MAVLRAQSPVFGLEERPTDRRRWVPLGQTMSTLRTIFTGPLPSDLRGEECSVAVLFRASQALNYLTGGGREMTFSARCHMARRTARSWHRRAVWAAIAMGIDAACGALRGECEHCATAWINYITRDTPA